jgi:fatty acid desaturase
MDSLLSESTALEVPGSNLLEPAQLRELNRRSTPKGLLRLAGHLGILAVSGYLWGANLGTHWAIALPALVVYGFGFAAMFAPLHECSHRTAFERNELNDAVGWVAGLLSLYNSTFFRRYHKWHHRYTLVPGKDPELTDPSIATIGEYLLAISGLPWWWGKLQTHSQVALGQLDGFPFIPETARAEVIRSTRLQLGVYVLAIGVSILVQQPWVLTYWLLPLFVGQPILRFILLAEHTGCSGDTNPLTNTRSTLTLFPLRFMMWDMPYHAEHHLYPSIPFHRLAIAHGQLKPHFAHVDPGYISVNQSIIANLNQAS